MSRGSFNTPPRMAATMTRAVLPALAGVVFLRVLGVSLLLAGFVEYGHAVGGSTFEAGLAFGAYPLALALFMLPLGELSDRIGRRAVLAVALAVSSLGGLLAAIAPNVWLLAAARFVQGAGAVNAVAIAVAAETGAPDDRTRRMAMLGAAAGGGFAAGLLLGAWLEPLLGVPGLLVAHSVAQLALVPPLLRVVPAGRPPLPAGEPEGATAERARRAPVAWLGLAGLSLNLSMTGLLFLSPLLVAQAAPGAAYGLVVTLMVLPAGAGMFVAARFADRGHARAVGVAAAALLALGTLPFLDAPPLWLLVAGGVLYFLGHSSLSSLLPSLAARVGAGTRGGRTQGILSTLQYVGSFLGASVAAALYPSAPLLAALFVATGLLIALGVVATTRARPPPGVTHAVSTKPF